VQVIEDNGQASRIAGTPGETSHEKLLVVARVVILRVGISELAGKTIGKRIVRGQVVPEVESYFLVLVGSARDIDFAEPFIFRPFRDEIHRPARIRDAEDRGVRALQHLDTLEGIRLFPHPAERAAQRQPVTIGIGIEAPDLEEVEAVIRTVEASDHAGGVLQHLLDALGAALFDLLGGDHGHRSGRIQDIRRHLAAA
jgi:hypothetical protein